MWELGIEAVRDKTPGMDGFGRRGTWDDLETISARGRKTGAMMGSAISLEWREKMGRRSVGSSERAPRSGVTREVRGSVMISTPVSMFRKISEREMGWLAWKREKRRLLQAESVRMREWSPEKLMPIVERVRATKDIEWDSIRELRSRWMLAGYL
jgi:hypothetical protein